MSTEPETQKTGMLEESPGVLSSKRTAGISLISAGAGLLLTVGLIAIFRQEPMPNASITITAGTSLIAVGGAILGVTALEHFGGKP